MSELGGSTQQPLPTVRQIPVASKFEPLLYPGESVVKKTSVRFFFFCKASARFVIRRSTFPIVHEAGNRRRAGTDYSVTGLQTSYLRTNQGIAHSTLRDPPHLRRESQQPNRLM